jgi:hypothetical protein
VPVVSTGAVVLVPVLLALTEAPCVVSSEVVSTVVGPTPVVVVPLVTVAVVPVVLVIGGSSVTVDCDAESVAEPASVGVVAAEVVGGHAGRVRAGAGRAPARAHRAPAAVTTGRQDAPGGHFDNIEASPHRLTLRPPANSQQPIS